MNGNGNGLRVPGWAVTAVVAIAAILTTGIAVGQKIKANESAFEIISVRLCRIERAVNLQPWPGCP